MISRPGTCAPRKELAHLRQRQIVEHNRKFIRPLPEAPILIGRSLGGEVNIFCSHDSHELAAFMGD